MAAHLFSNPTNAWGECVECGGKLGENNEHFDGTLNAQISDIVRDLTPDQELEVRRAVIELVATSPEDAYLQEYSVYDLFHSGYDKAVIQALSTRLR